MSTYTISLSDSNNQWNYPNLTKNGTNYVSEVKIDTGEWPKVFRLQVKDENDNVIETKENARLVQQVQYPWDNNRYYLAFGDVSLLKVENMELRAQIDYIAMMTGVNTEV